MVFRRRRRFTNRRRAFGRIPRAINRVPFKSSHYEPGTEKKSYTDYSTANLINNGVIARSSMVSGICQGVGDDERVGRKLQVKNILLHSFITTSDNATYNSFPYRIMLVLDTQANNSGVTLTELLQDIGTSYSDFLSFQNLYHQKRFVVLKDIKGVTRQGGWNGTTFKSAHTLCNMNVKCNIPIIYNGDAGTYADLPQNNIVLVGWAEHAATLHYNMRIRYTDK